MALFRAQNHGLVADELAHRRARHEAPARQEAPIRALRSVAVLMPAARPITRAQALAPTTPGAIATWIAASVHQPVAPGTLATRRRVGQGVCACRRDQGEVPQAPIRRPRPHILGPQALPRPMAADEGIAFVRGLEAWRDRTRLLLRRRGGRRVGEVSRLRWSALDLAQGPVRLDHRHGHVDRVGSRAPEVATALRQWQGLQSAGAPDVFPSRVRRQGVAALTARHLRHRLTRDRALAGIPTAYAPPARRHPCATPRLTAGAALAVVTARMGPRARDVTRRDPQLADRTTRAPDAQAMTPVEPRHGVQRRASLDDLRPTAIDPFRASVERRPCSAHPRTSDPRARRLCGREAAGPLAPVSVREVDPLVAWPPQHGRSWATSRRRLQARTPVFAGGLDPPRVGGNPVTPRHVVRRGRPLPTALSRAQVQRRLAPIEPPLERARLRGRLRCGLRVAAVAPLQREPSAWGQHARHLAQGQGRPDRRVDRSPAAVARGHPCLAQPPGARAPGEVFGHRHRHARPLAVKARHQQRARDATAAGITARGQRLRPPVAANLLEPGAAGVARRDVLGHRQSRSSARDAKGSSPHITPESLQTRQTLLTQGPVCGRTPWAQI